MPSCFNFLPVLSLVAAVNEDCFERWLWRWFFFLVGWFRLCEKMCTVSPEIYEI